MPGQGRTPGEREGGALWEHDSPPHRGERGGADALDLYNMKTLILLLSFLFDIMSVSRFREKV